MRTKITDDFIGKYAILKIGYAKGLVGVIQKNNSRFGVSPYTHTTKSGMSTGVIYQEHIILVDIEEEEVCSKCGVTVLPEDSPYYHCEKCRSL